MCNEVAKLGRIGKWESSFAGRFFYIWVNVSHGD